MSRNIFTQLHSLKWMVLPFAALATAGTANAQQSLTCIDELRASVDENCQVALMPSTLIADQDDDNSNYTIMLKYNGRILASDSDVSADGSDALIVESNDLVINYGGPDIYLHGRELSYEIMSNDTGNKCWGSIIIEDKLAPTFDVQDEEFNFECVIGEQEVAYPTATDNCGEPARVVLISESEVTGDICDANGQTFTRTFIAYDRWDNASAPFVQTINLTRGAIDFIAPDDVIISCEDYKSGGFDPSIIGAPDIYDETGADFCGYRVSYSDDTLASCASVGVNDGLFKIVRTWSAYDFCSGKTETAIQTLQIVDQTDPIIDFGLDELNLSADIAAEGYPNVCSASGLLPLASVTDACSGFNGVVEVYTPVGRAELIPGRGYRIPRPYLPLGGPYEVIYKAVDACGNTASDTLMVTVVDNNPPVTLCTEFEVLGLSGNSSASGADALTGIPAMSLIGDSYDNCSSEVFAKVIRMGADRCEGANIDSGKNSWYDDIAYFCCEDAGASQMVTVRVFDVDPGDGPINPRRMSIDGDLYGRYNDCMVEIKVEDKLPIYMITDAPVIDPIDCNNLTDLQPLLDPENGDYLAPTYGNQCGEAENIIFSVVDNRDICTDGNIVRTWIAVNPRGRNLSTQQIINIESNGDYAFTLPGDITYNNCENEDLDLGDELTLEDFDFLGCEESIRINTKVDTFDGVAGACYQIRRIYEIISVCDYNGFDEAIVIPNDRLAAEGPRVTVVETDRDDNNDGINDITYSVVTDGGKGTDVKDGRYTGRFLYYQYISVTDDFAPEVETELLTTECTGATTSNVAFNGSMVCSQLVDIRVDATDNCTEDLDIENYYLVAFVEGDDLSTGVSFENNYVAGRLEPNPFQVSAEAGVIRGNYPLGRHALVFEVPDGCGNVGHAVQFFDARDCKKPTPKARDIFTAIMENGMLPLSASMLDLGSYDNCDRNVKVTIAEVGDNGEVIGTPGDVIFFDCDDASRDGMTNIVRLFVTDGTGNSDYVDTKVIIYDNNGTCDDDNKPFTVQTVIATPEDKGIEGATVKVSNGLSEATSLYGVTEFSLAAGGDYTFTAERNDNGKDGVNILDVVAIADHLTYEEELGEYAQKAADVDGNNEVTGNDATLIIRSILGKEDISNSWEFYNGEAQSVTLNNLQANTSIEFVGVKKGDVDGSAQANSEGVLAPRTAATVAIQLEDAVLNAGETKVLEFATAEALAYQTTVEFDANALQVVAINGEAQVNEARLAEGLLPVVNDDAANKTFSLEVQALRDGVELSSSIKLGNSVAESVAATSNGAADVAAQFGSVAAASGYALEQNRPNPFSGATLIEFSLAEAGEATIMVTDLAGRVVYSTTQDFEAGRGAIEIAAGDLPSAGVLNYTLTAGEFTATRRMVVIK